MPTGQCWVHGPSAGGCSAARGGPRSPAPPGGSGTPVREARGGWSGSNRHFGVHDPGCCRYTTATTRAGTTGFEPATSRLTNECSAHLSYAPDEGRERGRGTRARCDVALDGHPSQWRGWDSNPRLELMRLARKPLLHRASLAGRSRTCGLRRPKPAGWPSPPQPVVSTPGGTRTRSSELRARCHSPSTTGA